MQSTLPEYWSKLILNPAYKQRAAYGSESSELFNSQQFTTARQIITSWPGYSQSPLRDLSGLARAANLASIHYKDESQRFGLGSFKPLGGAYAVTRLLIRKIQQARGHSDIKPEDILSGKYKDIVASITVTAATDGNHGRSVAWGARMCGCRCVIYIHEAVTVGREKAISRLGAEVRREYGGTYDDAVRKAQQVAKEQGWFVIQDTTDGDDIETTLDVMHGYTLLASESIEQLPYDRAPTHIFLQAGVGGMAAAVLAHFWRIYGADCPRCILVEPATAACCFLTVQQGKPTTAPGALDSIMAGLACGEISSLAWKILQPGAIAAMQIKDEAAADCMRLLADRRFGGEAVVAGESAVAGLAALIAAAQDETAREQLQLDSNSRVLLIGSEGATDPKAYAKIVGRTAEEVLE